MNLTELIEDFRAYTGDLTLPYLWPDTRVIFLLNEGERESCIRGRLLFDKTTEAICSIDVVSGTDTYTVDKRLLEIDRATLVPTGGGDDITLEPIARKELDTAYPDWRTSTKTSFAIVHDDTSIEIIPPPEEDYTLVFEVYRLPLVDIVAGESPEIAVVHHKYIVKWAMHRAYLKNDSDAYSAELSMRYEKEFEDYFWKPLRSSTRKRQQRDKSGHEELFV